MKHRMSFICALACALCLAVVGLAGCSSDSDSYEPETLTPQVSSPTIGEDGVLRVGVDMSGGAPFVASTDGDGSGLDIDIAAALADELGLELELVDIGDDPATAISEGTVDIVMSMSASSDDETIWVSDPYVATGVVLFAGSNVSGVPDGETTPTIAAQASSTSAWAVETIYGEDAIVAATDLISAFSYVEDGDADYVAADAVIGLYAALRQSVDVEAVALLDSEDGYCIGVSVDNTDLQTAVAEALATITSNGVADAITTAWLGQTVDLSTLEVLGTSSEE